jgi:hypothetical protein
MYSNGKGGLANGFAAKDNSSISLSSPAILFKWTHLQL